MGTIENIVGNIVGKGENAVYQHFLLFPLCFQMLCFSGSFNLFFIEYGKYIFLCIYALNKRNVHVAIGSHMAQW